MIKKLVGLFLWFCAATMLAQLCILGLSAIRGNVDHTTAARIVALLNGMDIQGKRLETALITAKTAPVPTHEEVLNARIGKSLDFDSRQDGLDRLQRQLTDEKKKLQSDIERFESRRAEFMQDLDKRKAGTRNDNLKEVSKIVENLSPEYAKDTLGKMLKNNEKADVVSIIKTMNDDKQKKLFEEFTSPEDLQMLQDILREIRNSTSIEKLIDDAKQDLAKR